MANGNWLPRSQFFGAGRPVPQVEPSELEIDDRKSPEIVREFEWSDAREMLDNAPTMMWRTTAAGGMDYANGRYLKAWQQSLDQIKGG